MTTSDCITIPLTHGYSTVIDQVDADLANIKWLTHIGRSGRAYARRTIKINGKKHNQWLHKVIYCRMLNLLIPPRYVDHIDNDPLNNKRTNLREVTQSQNMMNSRKQTRVAFKGAHFKKTTKKWQSVIKVNGKRIYLGTYQTAEEAHAAYCEASKIYHGEFGRTE